MAEQVAYRIRLTDGVSGPARKASASVRALEKSLRALNKAFAGTAVRSGKASRAFAMQDRQIDRLNRGYRTLTSSSRRAAESQAKLADVGRINAIALRSMNSTRARQFAASLMQVAHAYQRVGVNALRAARAMRRSSRVMAQSARRSSVASRVQDRAAVGGRGRGAMSQLGAGMRTGAGGARGLSGVAGLAGAGGPLAIAGAVGIAGAAAATVGAVKATLAIKDMAKELEMLDLAFSKLTKDAPATMKLVERTAADLGVSVMQVGRSFRDLMARGFSLDDAEQFTKLGLDLQSVGFDAQNVHSAMRQIAKIASQGKLQGDELMIMAEAGIQAAKVHEEVAKATGTTVDEVRKMQEAGKLTAELAIPAVKKVMLAMAGVEKAGDAARDRMKTLDGSEKAAAASFENLQRRIAKATGGAEAFSGIFKTIKTRLDELTPEQVEKIAKVIRGVSDAIEVAAGFAFDFVEGFLDGFGMIDLVGVDFKTTMKSLGPVIKAVGRDFGEQVKGMTMALGPLIKALERIGQLVALSGLAGKGDQAAAIMDVLGFGKGGSASKGSTQETFAEFKARSLAPEGANMANSAADGMRDAAQMHSPSKVFRKLGENMANSAAQGTAHGAGLRFSAAGGASSPGMGSPQGQGAGGATVVTIAPNIRIDGAGDPMAVAAEIKRVLVSEMGMAFDRMATQQGAA